jgi:hypothetical protein
MRLKPRPSVYCCKGAVSRDADELREILLDRVPLLVELREEEKLFSKIPVVV